MKDRLFKDHVDTCEKQSPSWCQAMDDAIDTAGCSEEAKALAESLGARLVFQGDGYAGYLRERWVGLKTGIEDTYWVFSGEKVASSKGPHKAPWASAATFRRLLAELWIDHPVALPGEEPLRDRSKEPAPPVFSAWAQSLAKIYGARVLFEGEGVAGLLRMRMDGLDYWVFATGPDRIAHVSTGNQIASAQAAAFRRLLAGIGIVYPGVIPGEEPPNGGIESLPPPDPPPTPELRNVVAELLHRKWSKDIKDVLCLATPSPDGGFSIAVENKVDVLQRSLAKYPELAAQHRQPNLAMADQIIAAVREYDREISESEAPLVIEEEPASPPWKADLLEVLDAVKFLLNHAFWGQHNAERDRLSKAVNKLKESLP